MHSLSKNLTDRRQIALSLIRLIGFLMIFICHIMSYYNMELAVWLNVGVQIFLCMSGFLYGRKRIKDEIIFYYGRLKKILIPYYTVVIPVIIIQFMVFPNEISVFKAIRVLLVNVRMSGGEHLWFIWTILMCYLITPLLQHICDHFEDRKWIGVLIIVSSITIAYAGFIRFYDFSWILCYALGYLIGRWNMPKLQIMITLYSMMNILQIYISYILKKEFLGVAAEIYSEWIWCNHTALGIVLFLSLRRLFTEFDSRNKAIEKVKKLCIFSDKYSYEAYLVHQFFIHGPLSIMEIIGIDGLNIVIVFGLTIIMAIIIEFIVSKLLKIVKAIEVRGEIN